jgi:uncharacterized protein DUF4238
VSVPAQPDPHAAARRLNELRAHEHDNVERQHVVSRVILKRFCDDTRLLPPVSVTDPNARSLPIGPRGAGWVKDFVPRASASAERLWAQTEDRLPRVLRLCDHDRVHSDPAAVDVLRNTLALHYVRSPTSLVIHERTYHQARAEVQRQLPQHPGFEEEFRRRFSGLLPTGPEAAGLLLDRVAQGWDGDYQSGLLFRHTVERIFGKSREVLSSLPIEVVHPASGEFLIGDAPVIVLDRQGRNGPTEGVALGDADQILMPLGPQTMIACGPADATAVVSEDWVKVFNSWQIRAAREQVFMRPGSGLHALVREVRFGLP